MKAERKKKNYTIVMQEDLLRASWEPHRIGLNAITVEAWGYPAADRM